jgi:putative MATE family efflux protein
MKNSIFKVEGDFYPALTKLMFPVLLQGFVTNALGFVDVLMIGQLGEKTVAAVGICNQIILLQIFLVFGIAGGAGVYTAQLWGRRFIKTIKQILSLGLKLSFTFALLMSCISFFFPAELLSAFTSDADVIAIGADYFRIACFGSLFISFTSVYSAVLRSTKFVRPPLIASSIALGLNTFLNYALIFGNFGFPKMGVVGAAYATVIARLVEFLMLFTISYLYKFPPHLSLFKKPVFDKKLFQQYIKISLPMVLRTTLWYGGVLFYNRIVAQIGTEEFAAYNVVITVERLGNLFAIAFGTACSIMVGSQIGKGDNKTAKNYSNKFLVLATSISLVIGIILITLRSAILNLYNFERVTTQYAHEIFILLFSLFWIKTINIILNMGIFKAGGDTKFSMYVDVGGVWFIGVPAAYLAAFVLELPIAWVIGFTFIEEIIKIIIGISRFISGKWINNLTTKLNTSSAKA